MDNLKITVDGHDYEVEHTPASMGKPEWILVWDGHTCLVANAEVYDNSETISIDLGHGGDETYTTYNYHDYFMLKELHGTIGAAKELARWMVSVA